ncbi:multicomponent Na+:H+ antiporter subunit F [Trueperella bonasi]|uniref:Multicomponent Na+:H+ antiporter subunit F n=1 Tax=Trueperella bonasi TaxID=312286 RepID=A0ABT9NGH5_9ACTO|nr:monovalent cation/H+ antiporter complex subunit F [Trueperella bonasi]MDP9806511.1 multicomponent Na+:H+ antiporter subunit F [Trueperella bonasi]
MIYVLGACMLMLVIAALLVTARAVKGPTSLDRMVSVDMISSILIGSVALLAALTRRSDLLALFIVLSLVGFVGSMTLARFITPVDPSAKRTFWKDTQHDEPAQKVHPDSAAVKHEVDALENGSGS